MIFLYIFLLLKNSLADDGTPTLDWSDLTDDYETVGEISGVNLWSSTFSAAEVTDVYQNCPSVSSKAINAVNMYTLRLPKLP